MEHEESIDLGRLVGIMKEKKKIIAEIIIICTVIAIFIAFIWPKQYESVALVQTRNASKESGSSAMAAAMGLGSGSNSTINYMELMKSRAVLQPIIDELEWEDAKDKPEADQFAKKYLDIKNTKQTNLITVTARGKTPEEAQQISQSVVDNFLLLQTDKNQQTQSLLVKFLNERIEDSKKEAEEASQKFADYQREHKIYSPEEKAKATVSQMNAFDNAIGDMQVQIQTSKAQLDSVNAQLGNMKSQSINYQINDNGNVQALRKQIVDAEVSLVDLKQHYTEENPTVVDARTHLDQLHQALVQEVNAVVASDVSAVNPTQMKLLQDRAQAETGISVAKASETAVKARRDAKQKELGDFPDDVLEYMNLQREASIKNEIYINLVKQCEQDKIQEAMESMDIQIIDPANLPDEDRPAVPRKKLIALVGFAFGCMMAFGYSLVIYKKDE